MDAKKSIEFDVVVVGGGNAGLVAAIEANDNGAKVLLLEKAPREQRGGNTRLTGGVCRIAYPRGKRDFEPLLEGSPLLAPIDKIDIDPYGKDQFYQDVMLMTEGLAEKQWTEFIVNESLETVTWMKKQGFMWDLASNAGGNVERKGDRIIFHATSAVLVSLNLGEGWAEMLYGIVEGRNIPVLYETAAQSLIVNADGKVCGVIAKSKEGIIKVDANSVILACGGFEANPEMRRRYLGEGWDLVKVRGSRYNMGEGLQMAFDVGAQAAGHWGGCHASIIAEETPEIEADAKRAIRYSYPYCILVNIEGKRFVDEGENFFGYTYAKMGRTVIKQPEGIAFQIFDAKVTPLLMTDYQDSLRTESNSLEELADDIGIDTEAFLETVQEFNAAVREDIPFLPLSRDGRRTQGLKPDKTNWANKIDTPPFVAYAVKCGLTFTYGGLKINERTQVMDTRGYPIEGLYAVGELPGGLFYHNYPVGTGLIKGAVTGRVAGREAAKASAAKTNATKVGTT